MLAFLNMKANPKKICQEMLFPSFFRKMPMSAFLLRFKANYLKTCVATLIFACKHLLFPRGLKVQLTPNLFFRLFKFPYFSDRHCEKIIVVAFFVNFL